MKCSICGLTFLLNQEHYMLTHIGGKEYRCMFCAKLFQTIHILFDHIIKHDGRSFCYFCKKSFDNYETLFEHIDIHSELHVYGCKECQWTSANKIKYLNHVCNDNKFSQCNSEIKLNVQEIECNNNVKGVIKTSKITQRKRVRFIADNFRKGTLYLCSQCPKKFKTSRGLKHHVFKHNNLLSFECEICGKKFAVNNKLQDHKKLHDMKENNYNCLYCNRSYKTKYSLAIHTKRHLGGFDCHHCSSTFSRKDEIKNHLRIKKCCNELFFCLTLYKKHITTKMHTFLCTICKLSFKTDIFLKQHISTNHREKVGTHKCSICGLLLSNSHNLARHKRRNHKKKYK